MQVEIRLYKRHDLDLIMLHRHGVPLLSIFKNALCAYADGKMYKAHYEPCTEPIKPSAVQMIRIKPSIKEEKEKEVIKNVRAGYRCQFCKALIRSASQEEPLNLYFSNFAYKEQMEKQFAKDGLLIDEEVKNKKKKEEKPKKEKVENEPVMTESKSVLKDKKEEKQFTTPLFEETDFENITEEKEDEKERTKTLLSMFEDMLV